MVFLQTPAVLVARGGTGSGTPGQLSLTPAHVPGPIWSYFSGREEDGVASPPAASLLLRGTQPQCSDFGMLQRIRHETVRKEVLPSGSLGISFLFSCPRRRREIP